MLFSSITIDYIKAKLLLNWLSDPTYSIYKSLLKYDYKILPTTHKNMNALRISKRKIFGTEMIGGIDLVKYDRDSKLLVDFYFFNSKYHCESSGKKNYMDESESNEIRSQLFGIAESYAKSNKLDKIQLYVHKNLKNYKEDGVEELGYKIIGTPHELNSNWILTEKKLF